MSGSAPTPRIFGGDEAERAVNPRSEDQMRPAGRNILGAPDDYVQRWYEREPVATTLATTTGQNLEGPQNAFDTTFWERHNAQEREFAEAGKLTGRWARPDATGIATWSHDGSGDTKVEFGDVFVNGRVVGNIYRGYGGMTVTDADEIMARLVLPREVWAAAYETEAGRPLTFTGNLRDEIQMEADRRSEALVKGLSAAAFEEGVTERAEQMERSGAWQTGNVAAGVGGGAFTAAGIAGVVTAATGGAAAPLAPLIVGVGAALGGFGAWLNRDEMFRSYSTALEQLELATSDGHTAVGYADAAAGFAGGAMQAMSVSRNLLHGLYDAASEGGIGDQSSAYQDTETPLWMQGLDMAALLVDGVGAFGSKVSQKTYTAIMGANASAQQASVTAGTLAGNIAFNPYSGTYEDIGALGMAQQQASVGIDVAQTAAAGVLGRVARRVTGRDGGLSTGGHVITGPAAARSARPGFSMLIPSEAAVGITARMMARRSLNKAGQAHTRENMRLATARQLEMLTTGRKSIAVATVNGFGEGYEEFVQAVLSATAFGERPEFRDLVEAAKQGFGMGAGMGVAIAVGGRSRSQVYLDRANVMRAVRNQEPWDPKAWDDLTETEQAMAGTTDDAAEQRLYDLTVRELVKSGARVATANYVELRRAIEVARQIAEQEMRASQPTVETARLSLHSNYEWGPQDYVVSLTAAIRDVEARGQALAGATLPDPRMAEMAAAVATANEALLGRLRQAQQVVDAALAVGDFETVNAEIRAVNADLAKMWSAKGVDGDAASLLQAGGAARAAAAWGARFPLNSAGSFQLLRLQIDPDLTIRGVHNAVLTPEEIQLPIGGDHDGDRFVNMLRELLPDETFLAAKYGTGQLTADGTMLKAKMYLVAALEKMAEVRREPGTELHRVSTMTLNRLRSRLNRELSVTSIPADIRRRLVRSFVARLASADHGALKSFFDTLAIRHGAAMRELGERLDFSPYTYLNRVIEDEMREFRNAVAVREAKTTRSGRIDLPATSRNMPRWAPMRVRQPSDIADAAMQANKYDIFRLQQVLRYNAVREAIETTPEETADVLAEHYRTFVARNDGIVRPGEQAIFETTLAQHRTAAWLRGLAAEYHRVMGTHTIEEAMVLLAGGEVADVDASIRRPRSSGNVRLIQALLREVVVGLRSEYGELMNDPAISQRLASLDSLTNPDYMDGDSTHAQGGEAFVEVLGAYRIVDLLGEQGLALAGYTVRSLRDYLKSLRWDAREEFIDTLTAHPSYENRDGEPTTPYRVLIDMVVESARMQLSEDRNTGKVRGVLANLSRQASENFIKLHDAVREIARKRRGGQVLTTAEEAREFLATDMRLSEALLRLVETRGVRAGTVQRNSDGVITAVQFSQWIYDVIAEPISARAEMRLLEHTLTYAKAALQTLDDEGRPTDKLDPHRVNDRILRLWLDLDLRANGTDSDAVWTQVARDEFLRRLRTSNSVDEFIGWLNTDFRFRDERTAPYMAWARDRSLVEADRYGKGVSDVQEDVEMRDALRDAAQVAATVLGDEQTAKLYAEDNADLISRLRESRDGVGDRVLWDRFVAWFDFAKSLPTLVGATVWIQQASKINEIRKDMGVKGVAPDNVDPLGRAVAAQLSTFDAAVGQLIASMTSGSMASVLTDMTMLARGPRTLVMNDGHVVQWEGVTPEMALDLLADSATAGLAARMLGLTAWDYNADLGQNVLVSLVGKGLAGFTAKPADSLFGSDTVSQLHRLMVLEGMSTTPGGAPIIPVILAERMNVREAAVPAGHVLSDKPGPDGTTERERMAVTELKLIANALDKLSRIDGLYERTATGLGNLTTVQDDGVVEGQPVGTGLKISLLHRTLLRAGRKARIAKGVDNSVARMLPPEPGPLQNVMHAILQQWVAKFSDAAVASGNMYMKMAAQRMTKDLNRIDDYSSPLDVLLDTYSDYLDPATQEMLLAHARAYGNLSTTAAWARDAVLKAQRPGQVYLRTKEWEDLARAVIAHTMHTTYGIATDSEGQIAEFPSLSDRDQLERQRSFWDPTFVESGVDIFAPGIMRNPNAGLSRLMLSQLELLRTLHPQHETVSPDEAERAVMALIEPIRVAEDGSRRGVTGKWHALVPALMHSAVGAVLSSAAAQAISMAGINPGRLRMLTATTLQDWTRRPPDSELSTATIDAATLIGATNSGRELGFFVDMQIAGLGDEQVQRPLAQLEGRVVRAITVTLPDGSTVEMMNHPRYSTGLVLPDRAGTTRYEAGVVNLDTLAESLTTLLAESNVPSSQWNQAAVEVSFFHPETKSVSTTREPGANYDHNPWFDGVGGATAAAFAQQSLLGSFFFGLGGVIAKAYDTALDAMKNLTFALQQVTEMPESYRQQLTALGTTDMARMLREMTQFALQQKIDGKRQSLRNYNAYHKLLSLLYVVRYIDTDGPRVLSAEEVIARQARGEQFTPEQQAQVVGLPLQHVLALMGELDPKIIGMSLTPWTDRLFGPDVSTVPQYTRFPDHAWSEQMFGGFVATKTDENGQVQWATVDLLSQPELRNQSLPRAAMRGFTGLSPKANRDSFGPYRVRQRQIYEERSRDRMRWSDQRRRVREALVTDPNIGHKALQVVQLIAEDMPVEASRLAAPEPHVTSTNDLSTEWIYIHHGERIGGVVHGIISSPADIAGNATIDDVVHVQPGSFYGGQTTLDVADVLPAAQEALRELMNTGASIGVPVDSYRSAALRRQMISYLKENGYAQLDSDSTIFVPRPRVEQFQTEAAFHSRLTYATHRTSRNRALIELSERTWVTENSIYEVNGGLATIGSYDVREVVQTGRYAGYAPGLPIDANERSRALTVLIDVLSSEVGREYLVAQSKIDDGDNKALADLNRALDALLAKARHARQNPREILLPEPGTDFGTGDIVPLFSYNTRGELVGIQLTRHGHLPVSEAALRGALPEGNAALGAQGVRLTIDRAKVDTGHNTRRGEVVSREWLGQQGFIAHVRIPLESLGSKTFEVGTAMKWTSAPAPSDLRVPSRPILAGMPVIGAADRHSPASKTADGYWLNTAGRIIETVGFDVMPHLVRLLTNVEYDENNPGEFATAEAQVMDVLRTFAEEHQGTIDPASLVTNRDDPLTLLLRGKLNEAIRQRIETAGDLDDLSTDQRVADITMLTMVLSAIAAGAPLNQEVLVAPGYVNQPVGSQSHTMHPVFTTLLDQLPHDHPARLQFVEQINARLMPPGETEGYELLPNFTWVRHVTEADGSTSETPVMLAFPVLRATDTNETMAEVGLERRQRGNISPTTLAMAFTTHGAVPLLEQPFRGGSEVFAANEYLHTGEEGARALYFGRQSDVSPFIAREDDDLRPHQQEQHHVFNVALPARRALSVPPDTSLWYADMDKRKAEAAANAYRREFNDTLTALRLTPADSTYLVEMIRAVAARPATAPGAPEKLTYREAMASLKLIRSNADQGLFPTHGGTANVVTRAALARLHQVHYPLRPGNGSNRPVTSWDEFVEVALNETFSDSVGMRGYVAVTSVIDGVMYEYRKDVKGLPATIQRRLAPVLGLVRSHTGLIVASPRLRDVFNNPPVQDGQAVTVSEMTTAEWMAEDLPQVARSIVEARMAAWEGKRGISRRRRTPLAEARRGERVREDLARTNMLMRYVQLGYVAKTLINPGLFASAFIEFGVRGMQERIVSFLAGENVGRFGQNLTPDQRKRWDDTVAALAESEAFYAAVYRNTTYQLTQDVDSRLGRWVERSVARAAGAFNDPTWMARATPLAEAFLEAAWNSASKFSTDRAITLEAFLETVGAGGVEALAQINPDAVAHGFTRIEYRRNLQDNLLERMRRRAVESVVNRGGLVGSLGVLLLRLPTMFLRFRLNTLINIFGLQGPMAAMTQILSDRTKRPGGLFDKIIGTEGEVDAEVSATARMEDSYDLTRAIIRSGVSHTQLMILGMVMSALGFGGGDDDQKKLLNKLRRYQQPITSQDPLSLENDFRNAQAWFAGVFPAGMGVPSWLIKPFVSPAMGVARFFETGDFRQVYYGFADALGALPLLNVDTVLNSWEIANQLTAAAEAQTLEDNVEATSRASRLMWTAVASLEAMLFESAFASMIYQAADEYDRDPYKFPQRDADDNLQVDVFGNPRPTNALEDFIDPETGEVRQRYANRTDVDAFLHQLGESRPLFALVASLIKNDSTFIRYNQPVKTREVDAQPLTEDEAAQIVVSVFNNEMGGEVLTLDGAEAVVRGVRLGTVGLDSPALSGIFIPDEMRVALTERFLGELTEKYIALGFSKSEALRNAKTEFYGQEYGAPEALGLADIIWSDRIPRYQTQQYYQLNTTYVMGPNGRPIATGLQRSVLTGMGLNIPGMGLFDTFHDGTTSNLDIDPLLNSVDAARGINLGMRGLTKVGENWLPPTEQEVADQIERAINKVAEQIDDLNDVLDGGYGYGRGYGGRGGGGFGGSGRAPSFGGQAQRLNTPRRLGTPYALDPRDVNTTNPIIRRATIRRERISSERGRLNQWQ